MKKPILLSLLCCGVLCLQTAELKAQLIKQINFSKAEGYTNGPLVGQPAGSSLPWASASVNKGDSVYPTNEVVFSVSSNETMLIHPDASGTASGIVWVTFPFPVQKTGPITATWDWQYFGTADRKTDFGFTIGDTENFNLDGDTNTVFNEQSAITRMGDLVDARNGDGLFNGDGTWVSDNGVVYRDGVLIHMRMVVRPDDMTFDVFATRDGEEEVQVADHFYFRRGLSTKNEGVNAITMWLNNGDIKTHMTLDNLLIKDAQGQVIKEINFSKAEGYTNGPLVGQPAGADSRWASASTNKGDTVFPFFGKVFSVSTNETMLVHPDESGTALGVIWVTVPFPLQKTGPLTATWDWQFFGTSDLKTDFGFTIGDTENFNLDGDTNTVFNEQSAITRMGDLVDARNGDGLFNGDGTWVSDNGVVFRDGVLVHMRMVVRLSDLTFDVFATREGEEEVQVADHFYFRRGLSTKNGGVNAITLWLNNGDIATHMTLDNILVVGPNPIPPSVSVERTAAGVRLTFTGTLQSTDTINGTFADVEGATSPLEVSTSAKAKFYRAKK